jgi:acetyltransferase-like isoleucine patch superfamily enzyme
MVSTQDGSALTAAKRIAGQALRAAKRREPEIDRALYGFRRAMIIARLRMLAAWHGASVEVDIAPDVRFGRDIDLTVWPGSRNVIRIGPGCTIGNRTMIFLNNGTLLLGDRIQIRRDVIFMLWGGTLEIAGENVLSWGSVFHCADSIRIGRLSIFGEWSTIVDSSHFYSHPDAPVQHNTKTGPVEIGYNTWVCAKAVIGRNSKIGDHCIVAGNAVVAGEVPSGHLASGTGAAKVRALALPWQEPDGTAAPAPRRRRKVLPPEAPPEAPAT